MLKAILAPFIGLYGIVNVLCIWFYAVVKSFLPRSQKSIKDEIVFVTGAGSGIGRLMSYRFAEHEAIVICSDINKHTADETANTIREKGGRAYSYYLDVTNRYKVYELAKKVKAEIGDVDILVNNAGVITGRTFMNSPDEMIIKTMDVNINAHFWTLKAFLGEMIRRNHGHIVTISSMAGHVGASHFADYAASKHATIGLIESLKIELFREAPKIQATTVCPFFINTGMFDGAELPKSPLFVWTEPEYAANEIVAGVLNNEREIFFPKFRCQIMIFWHRWIPEAVSRKLGEFFEVHNVMANFTGRYGKKQN